MPKPFRITARFAQIIVLAALLALTACERRPSTARQIDDLMSRYGELGRFNGSVLVAEGGKVIYKGGIGYADFEWEIKNTVDTKFRIASITKQFTSLLVLQQVAEGHMDLQATIRDYLPEYPAKNGDAITIHHLLSHTSGMPHYAGIPGFFPAQSRQPYEPEEFIQLFQDLDRLFEPGTDFSYSSFGYYLLGVILERVTGQSYEELLEERICRPAGMVNTRIDDHQTLEDRRASGYDRYYQGLENASYRDMSTAFSTGALFSTVEDLYAWDRALYTDQLLDPEHKALLFRPNLDDYGYGWFVERWLPAEGMDSIMVVLHGGGTNGFNSLITRILDDQHLIVLLRNTTGRPNADMQGITEDIMKILYGQPVDLPLPSAAEQVATAIFEHDIEQALSTYADLQANHPDDYDFSWREFNRLGYELIARDRVADALEVFKLNTAAFPDSPNTWDSLGEAYWLLGDREAALAQYRKALEIDPDFTHATEMIARIEAEE